VNELCAWGRTMFPSEKTPPCTRHAQEPVEETMVAALYWQLCGVHQLELRARARLIGGGHDRT
jgi:hypothetical protein